jgi:hypothetical protein
MAELQEREHWPKPDRGFAGRGLTTPLAEAENPVKTADRAWNDRNSLNAGPAFDPQYEPGAHRARPGRAAVPVCGGDAEGVSHRG